MGKLSKLVLKNDDNKLTYEEVVKLWENSNKVGNIFDDHLLIYLTSESSSVEGIDMSYNRTREIFESEAVSNYSGDIRELFSIMNNKNLAEFYNESLRLKTPITIDFIKKSHEKLMFASIDNHRYNDNKERAGCFKKREYCVGKFNVGVKPNEVEEYLEELICLISNIDRNSVDSIIKIATVFHCYFESIHPFADGNGRVGRWLLNYLLVLNNHPPIVISSDNKQEYYKCLEEFDKSENYDCMCQFLKKETVNSYPVFKYLLTE